MYYDGPLPVSCFGVCGAARSSASDLEHLIGGKRPKRLGVVPSIVSVSKRVLRLVIVVRVKCVGFLVRVGSTPVVTEIGVGEQVGRSQRAGFKVGSLTKPTMGKSTSECQRKTRVRCASP